MAKKKNVELGIDLQIQNYDSAIKELEKIEKMEGSVGREASKLKKQLIDNKNALIAFGSSIPTSNIKKFIKNNIDLSDSLGSLSKNLKITQTDINNQKNTISKSSKELENYSKQLEEAKQQLEALQKVKKTKKDIADEVLSKNTAVRDALDEKGVGARAADLKDARWEYIKRNKDKYPEIFKEVNKLADEQKEKLDKAEAAVKEYSSNIKTLTKDLEDQKNTLQDLITQYNLYSSINTSLDSASDSINENTAALEKVRDAAIRAGEGQIKVKDDTDKSVTSFQKAAKSVINYTVVYQGLKKILRESVRTIKEMDDAITGMTVVTNLSREEAWAQVEAFQAIAKATSSTMTEIAGLTTEYLKQGRAMKDAKILAEETAKSAKIAGISTADAVQYMTSAINGFNLAAKDATRVSDVFANLAAASATDFEDLAIAVSKVSAQANLAGMSLEYTTALLAKGIETTQEAPESIGTALKTIVARMRELSDYGSTLEDGGSVNKVERALAAAGIELRNVNGEFRNLEDIFSELGPKWDYLNSNQQQAIAQAVAGTRQQSRFVAIMQDWGRTQELIAEANASEGASAAQYAEYAKGIEAALTRMKTSWEGFVQSLANNKIVIGAINTATKIIEIISAIPDGLKVTIGLYAALGALNKLREEHEIKMQAYRQMAMSDEEKERIAQESKLSLQDDEIAKAKAELELLKEQLKVKSEIKFAEDKKELKSIDNSINSNVSTSFASTMGEYSDEDDDAYWDQINRRNELQSELNELTTINRDLQQQIATGYNYTIEQETQLLNLKQLVNGESSKQIITLDEIQALESQITEKQKQLEESQKHQMTASEIQLKNQNDQEIQRLKLANQKIELEEELLKLKIAQAKLEGKDTSAQEKALRKLQKTKEKNAKSINKLEQKNKKLQDGSYNIYDKMANLIGRKLGVNLKGITEEIKTSVTFAKTLVTDFIQFLGKAVLRKKIEKDTTKELQNQNKEKGKSVGSDTASTILNKEEKKAESDTTKELEKQQGIKKGSTLLEKVQLILSKLGLKQAKKENQEETKQASIKAGQTIAEAGEQGAGGNFAGMAIGIAGAVTALALAGIAAAISLGTGASGAGGFKAKEDKIASKQTANYDMKKSNTNANKALDEYTSLQNKAVKTEEEQRRIEELESEMQEMDEKFANLKGDALIKAVRGRVAAQEVAIKDNIQDSYEIAIKMSDISDSNVARQAITDKIISSQDKLIESNLALIGATEEETQAIKNNANNIAKQLTDQLDWDKAFGEENKNIFGQGDGTYSMARDYNGWDYVGATLGSALLGNINPVLGPITGIVSVATMANEDSKAREQQNKIAEAIYKFENASTEMAINMEIANEDLASQVQAYNSGIENLNNSLEGLSEDFKESALRIAESQYGTIAYIAKLDKLSDSNNSLVDKIVSIQKKTNGAVKQDSLIDMADALVGSALENKNKLETYRNQGNFGATSEDRWYNVFGGTNKEQDLSSIAKNLGLSPNASVNEIKAKLASQIKRNEDGTLKTDSHGNYAFRDIGSGFTGNNKELTQIFNNLSDFAEEIGYLADLSKESIATMEEWNNSILEAGDLLNNAFRTIDEQLLSEEELAIADETTKETRNAGYVFADAALEASETLKKEGQQRIAELEAQRDKLDKNSETYQSEFKAVNDSIAQINDDINRNSANMLSKAQEAIGYLDDAGWASKVEATISKRENLQGVKDAIVSGNDLTNDQIDLLYDEILPNLQKQDPTLTADKFGSIIRQKDLNTVKLIGDYLDGFLKNETASLQTTIGWNRRLIEFSKNELKDTEGFKEFINANGDIDNVAVEVKLDELAAKGEKLPDWYEEYQKYLNYSAEYESSKDKAEIVQKRLETESKLTEDEIKLANLRADIEAAKNDDAQHRLSIIKDELKYNELLNKELSDNLEKTKNNISSNLAAYELAFDDIFTIVGNQVKINTDLYKTLKPEAQEYITTVLDGLKTTVEESYDAAETIKDLYKEQLEETIDIQNTFIDAYKDKLEEEKDLIKESLDKRKDLYQEYFDWLSNQDEDETTNDIETLQQRIANLSSATDATSLQALKSAQEELAKLQKDSIKSKQEELQQQILDNLTKRSEQVDEYYDKQLENSQVIIGILKDMDQNSLIGMLKAADDYNNKTDAEKAQLDQKYLQLLSGWFNTAPGYSSGGLVDYTGIAMVHGSATQPEAFLNAEQTALFSKLSELLVSASGGQLLNRLNSIEPETINNNITIENFDININADMREDQDLYNTGNSIADIFLERIQASGIPVNIKR